MGVLSASTQAPAAGTPEQLALVAAAVRKAEAEVKAAQRELEAANSLHNGATVNLRNAQEAFNKAVEAFRTGGQR